jgi:predicted outer membrane repeat protein
MKLVFPLFLLFCLSVLSGPTDSISRIIEQYIDLTEPALPPGIILFENNIGDVSLCVTPDKTYYLTGTVGDKHGVNQGIMVWASRDMKEWNLVGRNNGYVWTFEHDASKEQKEIFDENGLKKRSIIDPRIHYIKGTFWITYTLTNTRHSGILKSVSGKAQGPYKPINEFGELVKGSNASLFEDNDSTVYFIWGNGLVRKMNNEMTDFADDEVRTLTDISGNRLNISGITINKINNSYVVSGSKPSNSALNKSEQESYNNEKYIDTRSDGIIATSNTLFGRYRYNRYHFPHAGGGQLFADFKQKYYYTFAGTDAANPMASNPTLLPVKLDSSGIFSLQYKLEPYPNHKQPIVYVSTNGNNSNGNTWNNAFTSIQNAIQAAMHGAQIWVEQGTYDGPVEINLREGLYIFGGFKGDETELEQRDPQKYKTTITGRSYVKNVISIKTCSYIRIDGFTITGGNASGGSMYQQYGGGIHILGGGESIRILNCRFENNKASQDGGGLYASIGAAPLLINCSFVNNFSMNNGGGAAIYANTPNGYKVRMINCTFDNNTAYAQGGAIFFDSNKRNYGMLNLTNCLIVNNSTFGEEGTIVMNGNANLVMANSTICFNKGVATGAAIAGLGQVPAKTRIYNSIFYYNSGGVLFSIEGEAENPERTTQPNIWVQFVNCLFEQNKVNALVQRNFDKRNWDNVDKLNQSVMGQNCLLGDPLFINHFEQNYRLKSNSSAQRKGSASFFFDFDMDGKPRKTGSINVGCY